MASFNLGRVKGSMWYTGSADGNAAIASALTQAGVTPLDRDLYLNSENGNLYQYKLVSDTLTWALLGSLKGVQGEGFTIKKVAVSLAALQSGYSTDGLPEGSFAVVETGNVEDPENSRLYIKGASEYTFVTDLSGSQGIQGPKGDKGDQGAKGDQGISITNVEISEGATVADGKNYTFTVRLSDNTSIPLTFKSPKGDKGDAGGDGKAATISIGTVNTGVAGSTAQVTNGGTSSAAVLNFIIPRGDKGEQGVKGDKGDIGDKGADGKTPTFSINANGELIATFE